ncbi:hypothetical protein WDW89_22980, partial [Deltaproteobacteria bacterium TL4]
QQSQHPLLTLFSNDREKVLTQFPEFYQERGLFEEISRYLYRLTEYYGIVESNMYTKADFLRDNPDVQSVSALLFPKIYYEALEKGIEKGREEGREEGIEKGIEKGEIILLGRLLRKKFGDQAYNLYQSRLNQCRLEEIELLLERIITATKIEEVFN